MLAAPLAAAGRRKSDLRSCWVAAAPPVANDGLEHCRGLADETSRACAKIPRPPCMIPTLRARQLAHAQAHVTTRAVGAPSRLASAGAGRRASRARCARDRAAWLAALAVGAGAPLRGLPGERSSAPVGGRAGPAGNVEGGVIRTAKKADISFKN